MDFSDLLNFVKSGKSQLGEEKAIKPPFKSSKIKNSLNLQRTDISAAFFNRPARLLANFILDYKIFKF